MDATSQVATQLSGEETRRLALDLSNEANSFVDIVSNGRAGFGGSVSASTTTDFSDINDLSLVLAPGTDFVSVDAEPLAFAASLYLDAGENPGGFDEDFLGIDFTKLANVVFEMDATGHITSNCGRFAGFEEFSILLGRGVNAVATGDLNDTVGTQLGARNAVRTGAGNDDIYSRGIDNVDGGADYDFWFGHYQTSKIGLTFRMQETSGTLSNGTTLTNVESYNLFTGNGNDTFDLNNTTPFLPGAYVGAGGGMDTMRIDASMRGTFLGAQFSISSVGEKGFTGFLRTGEDDVIGFDSIERLSFLGGAVDDMISLNIGAVTRAGGSLLLDCAGGFDQVALTAPRAGYAIRPDGGGGVLVNDIDRSNGDTGIFTLRNVEAIAFGDQVVDLGGYYGALPGGGHSGWMPLLPQPDLLSHEMQC